MPTEISWATTRFYNIGLDDVRQILEPVLNNESDRQRILFVIKIVHSFLMAGTDEAVHNFWGYLATNLCWE